VAVPFLSRAVLQQITQRVLSSVIEQLPERLAQRGGERAGPATDDLARLNALALGELQSDLRRMDGNAKRLRARIARLERRTGWRAYARLVATGLLTYALGFATAIILRALGWIG
jgi:hypothetical protein